MRHVPLLYAILHHEVPVVGRLFCLVERGKEARFEVRFPYFIIVVVVAVIMNDVKRSVS